MWEEQVWGMRHGESNRHLSEAVKLILDVCRGLDIQMWEH